MSISCFLRD